MFNSGPQDGQIPRLSALEGVRLDSGLGSIIDFVLLCLCLCIFVSLTLCLFYLFVCLFVCLLACLFACLLVWLVVCLFGWLLVSFCLQALFLFIPESLKDSVYFSITALTTAARSCYPLRSMGSAISVVKPWSCKKSDCLEGERRIVLGKPPLLVAYPLSCRMSNFWVGSFAGDSRQLPGHPRSVISFEVSRQYLFPWLNGKGHTRWNGPNMGPTAFVRLHGRIWSLTP